MNLFENLHKYSASKSAVAYVFFFKHPDLDRETLTTTTSFCFDSAERQVVEPMLSFHSAGSLSSAPPPISVRHCPVCPAGGQQGTVSRALIRSRVSSPSMSNRRLCVLTVFCHNAAMPAYCDRRLSAPSDDVSSVVTRQLVGRGTPPQLVISRRLRKRGEDYNNDNYLAAPLIN